MVVCRGQKALAAEVLDNIAAREAASVRVIERGRIVQRSGLLGRVAADTAVPLSAGDAARQPVRLPALRSAFESAGECHTPILRSTQAAVEECVHAVSDR